MSKVILRQARYQDIPHLEKLIVEGIKESSFRYPMPEQPAFYHQLTTTIFQGLGFVTVQDKALSGMGFLGISSWPWAPNSNFLTDEYYLVGKEFRASNAAVLLLDAMKGKAAEVSVPFVLSSSNGVDIERKDEFMERHGGERIGSMFCFWPPAQTEH